MDEDGIAVLFGGVTSDDTYLNDVYLFRLGSLTAEKLDCSGQLPEGRERHSAALYNDKMLVFGGWSKGGVTKELFELDLKTKMWKQIKIPNDVENVYRYGHSAVVYKDAMFVFGGKDASMDNYNQVTACLFGKT